MAHEEKDMQEPEATEKNEMEFGEQVEGSRDLDQDTAEAMQKNFAEEDDAGAESDESSDEQDTEFREKIGEVEAEDDFEAADDDTER